MAETNGKQNGRRQNSGNKNQRTIEATFSNGKGKERKKTHPSQKRKET